MANDATQHVVAGNGTIYIGDEGTALPDDIADVVDAGFVGLGFTSEEGVTWTDSREMEGFRPWQSFYETRRMVTAKDSMLAFQLAQWNPDTVSLAFGGGVVSATATGFKYTPPGPEVIDIRACIVEYLDGDKTYQLVFPRTMVAESVEVTLARTEVSLLPITLSLIPSGIGDPWYWLTDDPAFDTTP